MGADGSVRWLRVSLEVSGELAEAVADLLGRHAPGGVAVEAPAAGGEPSPHSDTVIVSAYLPTQPGEDKARREIERDLWYLGRIQPLPAPHFEIIEDQDWNTAWRKHYQPILVGHRLLICPSWLSSPSADRIAIFLDPGMAFGSGTHPSTQMCLEALEDLVFPGIRVADLGCGSGILAIAAAKLGAAHVLALDIDGEAIKATRGNAAANDVADRIDIRQGSLPHLLGQPVDQRPHLLLANILAPTLEAMLEQGLAQAVSGGGRLVLSGILAEQLDPLLARASQHGLKLQATLETLDWRTPVLEKPPLPDRQGAAGLDGNALD